MINKVKTYNLTAIMQYIQKKFGSVSKASSEYKKLCEIEGKRADSKMSSPNLSILLQPQEVTLEPLFVFLKTNNEKFNIAEYEITTQDNDEKWEGQFKILELKNQILMLEERLCQSSRNEKIKDIFLNDIMGILKKLTQADGKYNAGDNLLSKLNESVEQYEKLLK